MEKASSQVEEAMPAQVSNMDTEEASDNANAQEDEQEQEAPPPALPARFPRAAELQAPESSSSGAGAVPHLYWDRSHYESPEAQVRALTRSSTVYVGNLSFTTRSSHVYSMFSLVGRVKAVHMGLDRLRKTPCGFCFVEFWDRDDALASIQYCSGSKLDGSVVRVELDAGFQPGRQYGRGRKGGQVRDDKRDLARQQQPQHYSSGSKRPAAAVDADAAAADHAAGPDEAAGAGGYQEGDDDNEERAAKRQRI
jgi:nuclear cap-binding protein subunit 2